jgi:ubiquinone/menaquinone biosynthesis C-methylase UbiE
LKDIYENKELYDLVRSFYKEYYSKTLKLSDWESRFNTYRINEEEKLGKKVVTFFEQQQISLNNKKILIVGGGSGAEFFYINQTYSESLVYTVDPCMKAVEIMNFKADLLGIPLDNIKVAYSEKLPFESNFFDIVICYTVLEHVKDVEKSLLEMYRVAKIKGKIMIETPNYLFPEEQHYKVMIFPPKISKRLARLNLKVIGKYTDFFESLNFFSAHDIDKIMNKNNMPFERIDLQIKYVNFKTFIRYFPKYLFGWMFKISRNQLIFITKS